MRQIFDKDIANTERITIKDGIAKPVLHSGQSSDEIVRVTLNDGTVYDFLRDGGWSNMDFENAKRSANSYRRKHGLTEADLAYAFVSTGINPGLQLIAQTPKGQPFEAAICQTPTREFVLWRNDPEEG